MRIVFLPAAITEFALRVNVLAAGTGGVFRPQNILVGSNLFTGVVRNFFRLRDSKAFVRLLKLSL